MSNYNRQEIKLTGKMSAKKKLVPLPKLKKQAQYIFHKYIRKRDEGLPCISCGNHRDLQAGHYVPQSASSLLVMNEWNVNGECGGCNCFDQFHLIGYRYNLIEKIGLNAVKWLEDNKRGVKKWSRADLEEIITKYGEK